MKNWAVFLLTAALVSFLVMVACNPLRLSEDDTVTPRLESNPRWTAGKTGQLEVRLVAKLANGGVRELPFGVDDPVATIAFFRGENPLSPTLSVTLSHRC